MYDFTTILDRQGKDAIAVEAVPYRNVTVDPGFSRIPMWIADMSFPTAPSVTEAIAERLAHPCFGYFRETDAYYEAIIRWMDKRFGVSVTRDMLLFHNGVLGGLMAALGVLCAPGDPVLVHSPTYVGFTDSLKNGGYRMVTSMLVQDDQGIWRMDYEDMDAKIKENHIRTVIFCSPHNPCGRVWEDREIKKAMDVYESNGCYVIADEIWADLTLFGHRHIPTWSVSDWAREHVISLCAASKTFSLAGIPGAYSITHNTWLRERIDKQASLSHTNNMNVLYMHALIGAYSEAGAAWVDELKHALEENITYACDYIRDRFPGVTVMRPEGTYMMFWNCEQWCREHQMSMDDLLAAGVRVGVVWQDGRSFGGTYTIRQNLAVPNSMVREAFDRLDRYVFNP